MLDIAPLANVISLTFVPAGTPEAAVTVMPMAMVPDWALKPVSVVYPVAVIVLTVAVLLLFVCAIVSPACGVLSVP